MKHSVSILIALLFLIGSAGAKKLNFSELPEAVQKAIVDQKLGNEKGLTIREEVDQGKITYKIALQRDGQDVRLQFGGDGTVIKDSRAEQARAAEEGILTSPNGAV